MEAKWRPPLQIFRRRVYDGEPVKTLTVHRGDGTAWRYERGKDGKLKRRVTVRSESNEIKTDMVFW